MERKFRREDKAVRASKKSGSGSSEVKKSSWILYDPLLFLRDTVEPRQSSGNLTIYFDEKNFSEKEVNTVHGDNLNEEEKTLTKPADSTFHDNKAMDQSTNLVLNIVNGEGDKYEKFLDCMIEWVNQIPHSSILQYRMKLMQLIIKFKERNDSGKRLRVLLSLFFSLIVMNFFNAL